MRGLGDGLRPVDLLRWKGLTDYLDLPPIQEVPHLTPTQTQAPLDAGQRSGMGGRETWAQRHRKALMALE